MPPDGERLMLSFRPHSLRVEVADAARDARYVWMPGTVEASEFLGEFTRYRVRVGPYSTRDDAEKASARLKSQGIAGNLVAL